jgi:hypothetical protein
MKNKCRAHCRNIRQKNRNKRQNRYYPKTHHYMSWQGSCASMQRGGVEQVIWNQTSPLSQMMWPCKCFPLWIGIQTVSTETSKLFVPVPQRTNECCLYNEAREELKLRLVFPHELIIEVLLFGDDTLTEMQNLQNFQICTTLHQTNKTFYPFIITIPPPMFVKSIPLLPYD